MLVAHVNINGGISYLALQNTQSALEDVHDGVVDALPVVYDFVVMDASDEEHWAKVFSKLLYPLSFRFLGVPASLPGSILLGPRHESQELDVSRREEIPTAVHIDNDLSRSRSLAFYELREFALFFLD